MTSAVRIETMSNLRSSSRGLFLPYHLLLHLIEVHYPRIALHDDAGPCQSHSTGGRDDTNRRSGLQALDDVTQLKSCRNHSEECPHYVIPPEGLLRVHVLDVPWILGSISCKGQGGWYAKRDSVWFEELFQTGVGVEIGRIGGHEVEFLIGKINEQWQ